MPTKRELEERVHELEAHLEEVSDKSRAVLGYEDDEEDSDDEEDENL